MSDKNNNTEDQFVVANAMFSCDKGVAPAQLQVMQNQKVYMQNQLVITDKEVTFNPPAQTFGTCSLNPNKQAGQPCLYANGQWMPMKCYQSNNVNILTENSEMICPMFGGKVGVIFPGQTASVSVAQLETCEMELAPALVRDYTVKKNDAEKNNKEPKKFPVNGITWKDKNIKSSESKKQCKEIYIRKGVNVTFEVNNPKLGETEKKYVSWIVGKKSQEENKQDEGESDNENKETGAVENIQKEVSYLCKFYDMSRSPIEVAFHQSLDYYIEGVGYKGAFYEELKKGKKDEKEFDSDGPKYKGSAFLIHSIDYNVLKSISITEGTYKKDENGMYWVKQGEKVTVKVKETLLDYDTKYEIVHCDISQKEGTVPDDMYQYTDGSLELTLTPKNAGEIYTVNFRMHRIKGGVLEEESPMSSIKIVIHCYSVAKIVGEAITWGVDNIQDTISKARPGAYIKFSVEKDGKSTSADEKLKNVDWKIENLDEPGIFDEQKENSDSISYKFEYPGKYRIIANLTDAQEFRSTDFKGVVEHEIEIKHNKVTGIRLGNISRYIYAGVKYPIELKYDYGDKTSGSEKKCVEFKVDDGAEIIGNSFFKASVEKEYNLRAVLNWETCSKKIKVVMPTYDKWQFSDSKGKKINQIARFRNNGQSYEFGIDVSVPAWQILKGMTENKNVYVVLYGLGTVIKLYNNVKLSDEGSFSITKISVKEIIDILKKKGVYKGKGDVLINFNVHNMPTDQIRNINRTNKQGIYLGTCSLRITDKFVKEGSFIDPDKDNKKLIDIKKYGDKVKVWLRILNPGDRKLCLRVYENKSKSGKNPIVYEKKDFQIDDDGNVEIEIPTNGGKIKKDEHGDKKLPRLFYFQLECDDKVVYSYPQSPGDLYNYDVIKNKEQITNNKQEQSKARSYFEQLKLLPETKDSEYCETYSKLVPVVIGEEKKKKEEKEDNCKCPNCHEDASKLEARLKKIFPNAPAENVKIAAETYTTYMKKFQMDTCWIKAHFFAQAYIETGGTLSTKEEEFYYSVANLYYSGTFSKFLGKKELCAEYGACDKETNFKYKSKTFEKSWLGSIKPHTCDQKKLANYVYSDRSELGNKGGDDGWNFRGRGVVQVTGRNAYESIEKILKAVGYDGDCDISSSLEKAGRVSTVELGIVSSMAFFWYKNANMYRLCNGKADDADVENVSNKVGAKDPKCEMKIEGEPCISNHNGKKMAFRKIMKKNFEVDDCKWDEFTEEEEKLKMASYHIYANGHVEKHIPANLEDKEHYAYFYYDEDNICYQICTRTIHKTKLLKKPVNYGSTAPTEYEEKWSYTVGGTDGKYIYILKNGDKVVISRSGKNNKRYSQLGNEDAELVRIDENCVNKTFEYKQGNLWFKYTIQNATERFYSNPDVFAIFIGILAEMGSYRLPLNGSGNVEVQNTGYPSITHRNGYAFDFSYFKNIEDNLKLYKAAYKFRCNEVNVGHSHKDEWDFLNQTNSKGKVVKKFFRDIDNHESHIHLSVYHSETPKKIIVINEK